LKQTYRLWVEDQPGVLMRVAGPITAKGANIRSLTLAPDPEWPGRSKILLEAELEARYVQRVLNEMNRLIPVIEADLAGSDSCSSDWRQSDNR
jgi:acetolactate synthase-1/3 small subunit